MVALTCQTLRDRVYTLERKRHQEGQNENRNIIMQKELPHHQSLARKSNWKRKNEIKKKAKGKLYTKILLGTFTK